MNEKLGHMYQRMEEFEDDQSVPRQSYITTEAISDAEGGLLGGLVKIGALVAAGTLGEVRQKSDIVPK